MLKPIKFNRGCTFTNFPIYDLIAVNVEGYAFNSLPFLFEHFFEENKILNEIPRSTLMRWKPIIRHRIMLANYQI